MKGLNKVMLIGTLGANPDFRILNGGSNSVATASLATNESYRDQQGNIQERTEWHRLVFWGKQAEIAHEYLHKGSQIYVEGKIRTRSYEDKNGKKSITEIQVMDLQMLGGKSDSSASQTQQQPQQGYQQPYSASQQNDNAPYAADEYAF